MSKRKKNNQEEKKLVGISYDEYREKHGETNNNGLTGVSYEDYQKREQQRRLKAQQQQRADELLQQKKKELDVYKMHKYTPSWRGNSRQDELKKDAEFVGMYSMIDKILNKKPSYNSTNTLKQNAADVAKNTARSLQPGRSAARSEADRIIWAEQEKTTTWPNNEIQMEKLPYTKEQMEKEQGRQNAILTSDMIEAEEARRRAAYDGKYGAGAYDAALEVEKKRQNVQKNTVSADEVARIGKTPDFMINQDKLAEINSFYDMIDRVKRIDEAYKNMGQVWGGRTKEVSEALNFENAVKDIRNRADVRRAGMNDIEGDISELNREQRNQRREDANKRLEEIEQKRADLENIYNLDEKELAERFPEEYQGYLSYLNEPGHPERIDFIDYLDMNKALDSKSLGYDYDEAELRETLNELDYYDEQDHNLELLTNKETRTAEKYTLIQQNRGRQQKIDDLYNQLAVADQTTDVDGIRQQISSLEAEVERDNNKLKELDQYGILDDNTTDDTAYHPEYFEAYKEKNPEMVANATTETNNIHVIMDFLNRGETFQKWYKNEGFERTITGSFSGAQVLFAFPEIKNQLEALYNDAVSNGREPVEAQAFFNALQPYLNQNLRIYEEIENRSNAAQHPGLMTLGETVENTLTALPQMIGTAYGLATGAQWASDKYSPWFATQRQSSDVEGQVSEMLGPVGGFVYQAGLSAFKNLLRASAMSGLGAAAEIGTLTHFFGEAFNSSYYSGLDKFKNQDKAAIYALVDAGISTFFEVASVEKMFSDPSNYIQYLLQNMGAEMSEEGFEAMFGPYIHKLMDGTHEWEERGAEIFSEMRKNGYFTNANGEKIAITDETYGEAARMAKEQAMREWNTEIIKNMGSAALSVGGPAVFGGFKNVIQRRAENSEIGKKVKSSGISEKDSKADKMAQEAVNEFTFLEAAANMGENTKSAKLALEIRSRLREGKRVSNADFGKLARTVVSESNEQISGITMNVLQDKVKQDLADLNISEEDRTLMAEMITKKIIGAAMTDEEKFAFSQSDTAKEIAATYGIGIGTGMASVVDMGRVSEAAAEIGEKTKDLQETQKTVLEMVAGPIDEKGTAENISDITAGAKVAENNDFLVAQGKRTNSDAEVIADGKIADIQGIALKNVINPETNKQEARFQITTSDGREVDLSQVKAANKGVAETLQFLQNDQGQTVGTNLANAVLNIVKQNNSDATKTLTGAVRIMWAAATEQKAPVTGLNRQDADAIRQAVQADMRASEEERLGRFREIKPGQGKVTFNGAEYGSNEFNNAVQKLGGTYRIEAQTIGSIAKSAGFDVELYFDEKDTANQGSFSRTGGIRINLAGTYTADGAHRSALATLAHEITHNLEANSQAVYRALKKFVFSSLGNKFDMQNELQNIMATYKVHGQTLDISGAVSELVAKASELVLTDEEVIKQMKGENPDLSGAMNRSVMKLVDRVNSLRGEALNTSSKYAKALMQVNNQVGKIWAAAYQEARGAKGTTAGIGTAQASKMEYENDVLTRDADYFNNILQTHPYITITEIPNPMQVNKGIDGLIIKKDVSDKGKSGKYTQKVTIDEAKGDERSYTYVPDLKINVELGREGLTHGFGRNNRTRKNRTANAMLAQHTAEILQNAVEVNRGGKYNEKTTAEHIMIAGVRTGTGDNQKDYAVEIVIHNRKNQIPELVSMDIIGTLYSINEKETSLPGLWDPKIRRATAKSLTIKLSDFFNAVKNEANDIFAKKVYEDAGMQRVENDLSKNLQHSFQEDQNYMAAVKAGDMETAQRMVDEEAETVFEGSKVRGADGKLLKMYHGTGAEFNEFRRDMIGSTGRFEGSGFNFTPYEGRAASYGKNVLAGYLNIQNPLSAEKKTLTVSKLAKLIRETDPTGDNIISDYARETRDYGKPSFISRESITAARALWEASDSDVDIYSFISAADSDAEGLIAAFEKLGYDGLIHYSDDGKIKTAVAFSSEQFKRADPVTYDDNGKEIPLSERFNTEKKDIRYSMQEDEEKYQAAVDAGDMKSAAKMVENAAKQNGYTMKVYHGTPTGGFTVFRDWSYFTENKDYADRYQSASASSIRGSYETTNPMTYALYMNPGKVFDTRKYADAKLYNEARMEYGLGELSNTDSGLPDWTDGRDIIEFIEDRGLDYDTILLDEGGDPGENGPTKRGISYVTRANNVKNADPVTYDSKGKVVKLSERFNRKSNNIQFSMQEPVEVNKAGLIAVHNLTERQLMATIDEGGFTAASIAVVLAKMGHSKFGPISAVFKPSAIDPNQSAKNRIYGADAFTPTRYNAKVHTKLINKGEQAVRQELQSVLKKVDESLRNEAFRWLSEKAYGEYTDESIEEWAEKAYNNVGMLAAYQADHGAEVKLSEKNVAAGIAKKERKDQYDAMFNGLYDAGKFDEFWDDIEKGDNRKEKINKYGELLAGIIPEIAESWNQYKETQKGTIGIRIWNWIEEFKDYMKYGFKETSVKDLYETRADLQKIVNEADFNEWFIDKFSRMFGEKGIWKNVDPFTASGESKSFRQTHLPYSAENVVRAMYNNVDRKGVSAYGASGLIASASKEYANLDEVRKDTARLQLLDDEEYSKLVDELDAKMNDLAREISPDYPDGGMDAMIEAGKAYARNQSAAALKRAFAAQDFKLTDAQIAKAKELMDLAREFPTGYFEAKPERVSGFDELYKIIIPENAGDKMFRKLEENNIPYETYNGTEEDRLRILNEQTDAQFSFMDETDVDARAWMETVNENSLQTEAEKQLLRNFKSLRMRVSLKQEQERKIQEEIKRLQGVLNGNEGKGEETGAEIISMVEALKSVGIDVKYTKNGKWLMLGGLYNGTRIGKLAGKNKITLQRASEAVKMKLQDLGFTYDNVTLMWEYPNRTRKTMGNTEIERQLNTLETRLEKATQEKQAAQDELAKITSSNGYASLMYRQQRVLNDFVYGRTQDEVRGAVDRLEKSAANIAKRIEEEQRKAEEQAKNSVVQRFREILGTTTVDQTAAALKKRYNSTWTKNQLKVYLEPIILKMKAGEDFTADVETLAGILVNSDNTNTYEELSGLRGLVITLGPGAQKELRASNSSLKEIRARLAGTGIQVKFGERSSLETDIEDLRAEYPSIPELGDEKDALENFVSWVEGMKSQSAANEFYEQRIAEAMAVITQQAAGAAKGIYMPTDPKAAKQVLAMMEFVKGLNAETQAAQKMLQDVAKDMEELQKAGRQASGMAVTLTHDATTAIDYFNRMARIAEDQAKQKTRKDLIEQLKSDFAQKVAKNNEEWRNLIERDAKARKQAEKNMSSRGQINTVVKRLYDLLKNPKGTRNIPEHMQGLAREIVGVIVENDLSEMKHKISRIEKKNLMEAQRVLQAWEARDGEFDMSDLLNMDPENASMLVINQDLQQIYDGIEKFNQEIRGKNKLDTLQQRGEILTQIQEAMSEIYTAIRAEGEVFLRGRKVATEDAAAEVMNGTGGKKFREWYGKPGQVLAGLHKAIVSGNMTPEYFFRTIGNKGLNDLWENYHAAENRNGLELAKAKARLDEIAKKYGYEKWDTKERHTVHLQNGDVQMTLGQIMALWATWNRENTLGPEMSNHLTGGGFHVEQKDLREGWKTGRTEVEQKSIKLAETDEETGYNPDIQEIESLMTQEQKDYVNDVVMFMSNDMSELGNEASMAAYGIRMYKEKYYFPFKMWGGVKDTKSNAASQGANVDNIFRPSFSKTRLHGANNAIEIGDFMQVATDHIAGMINYATMGLANESLQKVLNQKVQEGGELDQTKRNIKAVLQEAYGQEALQYLTELQRQLNGGAVRTSKSLGDKAISLFRKNAVAGSLSVALQQPLSYIRAAVMVNPKYLAAALNPATWKGSYQEMMAHSGVAVIKDMGRFDMNAGQSAREYLTPEEMEGKAAKIWGQITDKATILPEMMDRVTWTRMWSACKAEQAALHPEMDVKSDEFLDMVGERFNDLMRRTQVYDSVLVKSANMRSDNYWVKSLTSFMAEPTLTLNVLADAVREAKSGTKEGRKLLAMAGTTYILSAVMQAFFKGLIGSGRNPDDKKNWDENFLYRFWSNFINEADPVQLIPGYNDLVTLLKDGELEDDAMGALGKLFTAGKGTIDVLLGNGNKGVYRDLEDSVGQLAQLFTNLPAKNIMRDARAMYNFIAQPYAKRPTSASVLLNQTKELTANADNMLGVINKWFGDAGYQTSNTAYYQRIYQAKKAGNEQAAQSMIDYLLTGKGVTEKAISSGINSAAKKDTGVTEAETAEFLISEGSTSADDYVTEQLKAGKITAEEARKLLKQAQPEKSDDDIWWTVDRIEYQRATGAESISGKYYRLWEAMDANRAEEIGSALKIMTSHGMTEKNIKSEIGKHYKQAYLDGDSTEKRTIRDAMQKAYRKLGFTAEDANKTISNWEKDAKKKEK